MSNDSYCTIWPFAHPSYLVNCLRLRLCSQSIKVRNYARSWGHISNDLMPCWGHISNDLMPLIHLTTPASEFFQTRSLLHRERSQIIIIIIIGAFACSGPGVWNAVSDAFAVFLLKGAPEKCGFTNHVPQLRLKVNSITQAQFFAWKYARLFTHCQGYQDVKTNYWSLSMVTLPVLSNRPWNTLHNFFVLRHTRNWERTLLHPKLHPKPLRLLTAPILSRARVWKFFVCVWPKTGE